jgi:hypothetical protein
MLSQHHRSTLGMTRTSSRAFPTACALAVLLGLSVALSACGAAQEAGAAAIVDGKVISEQDVQSVADQISALSPGEPKLSPSAALFNLIIAPYVIAEGKRAGKTVSDAEARKVVAGLADPLPKTIELLQLKEVLPQLDQVSRNAVLEQLRKTRITVNPRYGTFDAKQVALAPNSPNWIKPGATSPAN